MVGLSRMHHLSRWLRHAPAFAEAPRFASLLWAKGNLRWVGETGSGESRVLPFSTMRLHQSTRF